MLSSLLLFGGLGGWEIFLIIFAILVLFGAKKIPDLARGLGQGIREFKDATKEVRSNLDDTINPQAPVARHTPPTAAPRPMDTPATPSNPNPGNTTTENPPRS